MIKQNYQTNGKVFYRDAKLLGGQLENGREVTPEQMLDIHEIYETLLLKGHYRKAEVIEESERIPEGYLNGVVAGLILDNWNNGRRHLSERLIGRFGYRGYTLEWVEWFQKLGQPSNLKICDAMMEWVKKDV